MFLIPCPHCGPRAQAEFVYERTLDGLVTLEAEPDAAMHALYTRENPRGYADELWRHTFGCRSWLVIRRHRVSHQIAAVTAWGVGA